MIHVRTLNLLAVAMVVAWVVTAVVVVAKLIGLIAQSNRSRSPLVSPTRLSASGDARNGKTESLTHLARFLKRQQSPTVSLAPQVLEAPRCQYGAPLRWRAGGFLDAISQTGNVEHAGFGLNTASGNAQVPSGNNPGFGNCTAGRVAAHQPDSAA